jgi:WD40 repeat protein
MLASKHGCNQNNSVSCISISPQDKHITVGCSDGQIQIWNTTKAWLLECSFSAHAGTVYSITYNVHGCAHTGKQNCDTHAGILASAGADATIKIWHVSGQVPLMAMQVPGEEGEKLLWLDSAGITHLAATCLSCSAGGHEPSHGSRHHESVSVSEPASKPPVLLHTIAGSVQNLAPSHSLVFLPKGDRLLSVLANSHLKVWDVWRGTQELVLNTGLNNAVRCVACSSDGKLIATGSECSLLCLWDARTGEKLAGSPGGGSIWVTHPWQVPALRVSPFSCMRVCMT